MIAAARRVAALGALAVEARASDPWDLAEAARRASALAGELLAARGTRVVVAGAPPVGPALLAVAGGPWTPLAVLAATPGLLAPSSLEWRVRAAVAALGLPRLDREERDVRDDVEGALDAFAAGVAVIGDEEALRGPLRVAAAAAGARRVTVSVLETPGGWRVVFPRGASAPRLTA